MGFLDRNCTKKYIMTMAVIMEEEQDVAAIHQIPRDMHKVRRPNVVILLNRTPANLQPVVESSPS